MVRSCKNKYQKQWQKLISLGVTLTETETLCDSDIAGGFGQLYDSYRK